MEKKMLKIRVYRHIPTGFVAFWTNQLNNKTGTIDPDEWSDNKDFTLLDVFFIDPEGKYRTRMIQYVDTSHKADGERIHTYYAEGECFFP